MFDVEMPFIVLDNDGNEIECEALFTHHDIESGKHYLVYTDYSTDEDGRYQILASIFDPFAEEQKLLPIETEEEWDLIDRLLNEMQEEYAEE